MSLNYAVILLALCTADIIIEMTTFHNLFCQLSNQFIRHLIKMCKNMTLQKCERISKFEISLLTLSMSFCPEREGEGEREREREREGERERERG